MTFVGVSFQAVPKSFSKKYLKVKRTFISIAIWGPLNSNAVSFHVV